MSYLSHIDKNHRILGVFFKYFDQFIILNQKPFQKVFCLFKNGQKKCPKLKRVERLLKKQHL